MNQDRKEERLIRDTLVFAVGSLGTKLIQFFMVPLYTNFMSQSEYGITNLIFTIAQLLFPMISLTVYDAVLRFGMANDERREDVLKSALSIVAVDLIISALLIPFIKLYEPLNSWAVQLVCYLWLGILHSTVMNYLKVKNKNVAYSGISIIHTLVLAALNIVFIARYRLGIDGYMSANNMAMAVACVLAITMGGVLPDARKGHICPGLLKRMIRYSSPLIFNAISWWLISSSDKIMIELMCGSALLGLYSVASKIPALINVFINIFQQSWGLSAIREVENEKSTSFYTRIFSAYNLLIFGVSLIAVIFLKPLMNVYIGKEFLGSVRFIPFLILSAVFSAMSSFWGTLYTALKDTKGVMTTTIIAGVVNVIVNFAAIRMTGVMGAVIGTVVSYVLVSNIRMVHLKKTLGMNLNIARYAGNCILLFLETLLVTLEKETITTTIVICIGFAALNIAGLSNAGIRRGSVS